LNGLVLGLGDLVGGSAIGAERQGDSESAPASSETSVSRVRTCPRELEDCRPPVVDAGDVFELSCAALGGEGAVIGPVDVPGDGRRLGEVCRVEPEEPAPHDGQLLHTRSAVGSNQWVSNQNVDLPLTVPFESESESLPLRSSDAVVVLVLVLVCLPPFDDQVNRLG